MAWVNDENTSLLHRFCMRALCTGAIPHHVAFIMDGNRRYARKNNYERARGHLLGFDKLSETLRWCLDIGITEVTVYAFSIENFKRSKDEVDGLMELARNKFARLLDERHLIDKYGVCIRVLGNINLLPRDIQEIVAEGVNMTKHNNRAILNICFAYTSRDEICHAMQCVAEGVSLQMIRESDISESLLERCLYSSKSKPPDLLIRTSGEVRLSDFLLWQSGYSVLSFVPVLWPEFSRWHFYAGILHYQMNVAAVQKAKAENDKRLEELQLASDLECLKLLEKTVAGVDEEEEKKSFNSHDEEHGLDERLERYRRDRETRIADFLQFLERRNDDLIASLLKSSSRPTPPIVQSSLTS
jgi:ditrans,polycis-polyprenyl diphosphate synthase